MFWIPASAGTTGAGTFYEFINFDIIKPYTLRIKFDDDMERIINFRPVLEGIKWGHSISLMSRFFYFMYKQIVTCNFKFRTYLTDCR